MLCGSPACYCLLKPRMTFMSPSRVFLPVPSPQPARVAGTPFSSIFQVRKIEAQQGLSDSPQITWTLSDECPN